MALSLNGTTGIVTGNIAASNITTATIADDNVTTAKILNANVTPAKLSQPLTLGTAVNASGTSVDFTGIPSWVKRVTVMLQGVSTNGSSGLTLRVGTSSGFVSSGYLGASDNQGSAVAPHNFSTGFDLEDTAGALSNVRHYVCTLFNVTGNNWMFTVLGGTSDNSSVSLGGGSISAASLGGTLDRVRITSLGGTDTFDAGSINIMYEG